VIAQLQGRLLRKATQEVVVDVHGVGYRVQIPLSTFYKLPLEGEPVELRTHTHVREDALLLFGFLTGEEQELFERLIAISGVGPKVALNILSGIEAPDLVEALRSSDIARLTRVPGVGKKTAERLVLELKDKMPAASPAVPSPSPAGATRGDLVSALVHLGYSQPEADRAAELALRDDAGSRFEDALRRALRLLATR